MSAGRKATKPAASRLRGKQAGRGSEIGARVAALRARAGLTQGDVAERLGMSQRLLSYYEREATDIPASMLVPLAEVLNVEVCWLLDVKPAASCRKQAGRGYLQERFEAVREMPRKDQQFVVKFLDQVIEDYARRKQAGKVQGGRDALQGEHE